MVYCQSRKWSITSIKDKQVMKIGTAKATTDGQNRVLPAEQKAWDNA